VPDIVFPVRFDSEAFEQDLHQLRQRDRPRLIAARHEIERDGVPFSHLCRCKTGPADDGTDLTSCAKMRVPWPDGPFGFVLVGDIINAKPYLVVVATGERHPKVRYRESVYQIAHHRLHDVADI
jgi:hypothetical protein